MMNGGGNQLQEFLSFSIRHSVFDIRYFLKRYPVSSRLRGVIRWSSRG
jgi:hypothetical protein